MSWIKRLSLIGGNWKSPIYIKNDFLTPKNDQERQDLGTVQVKIGQKWMKLVKNMENVTSILANLRPFKGY